MRKGRPMSRKGSKKYFTATAMKTHPLNNVAARVMRGGFRL